MATAHQIRDLITQTNTGTVRPRVPREVRDEVRGSSQERPREHVAETQLLGNSYAAGGLPACRPTALH
jgi:hypothetical protein